MERVNSMRPYIYMALLIAFSTFEYFFRSPLPMLLLSIVGAMDCLMNFRMSNRFNIAFMSYLGVTTLIFIAHALMGINSGMVPIITNFVNLCGFYFISRMMRGSFAAAFVKVVFFISLYSLVIYLVCLDKGVQDFLYNNVASYCSLDADKAVIDGGGKNFCLYNFQSLLILPTINYWRNCGPFWEPGMFAVYIVMALFFNLFVQKQKIFCGNIILICALISTFSTGGYIAALLLAIFYILKIRLKSIASLVLIPLLAAGIVFTLQLEFVGEKTQMQFSNNRAGSDISRFGAMATQLEMIEASPLVGGEPIKEYASTKTLASGTLLPMVNYGVPFGIFLYILLVRSCVRLAESYRKNRLTGFALFLMILVLSFSQTILMTPVFITLMIYGMQSKKAPRRIRQAQVQVSYV